MPTGEIEATAKKRYTIGEVVKKSGLSRTSIIQLEEAGFLKPCYVDPASGYRYFDRIDITQLLEYKKLRSIGLTQKDILDFYRTQDADALLHAMEERLATLSRCKEEIELWQGPDGAHSFSFLDLPAYTCYFGEGTFRDSNEVDTFARALYNEMEEKGYKSAFPEPPFAIRYGTSELGRTTPFDAPFRAKVCLQLLDEYESIKDDPKTLYLPPTKAFSILYHGDYDGIPAAWKLFWDEIFSRELDILDEPRSIGVVIPAFGRLMPQSAYVFRFAIPLKDTD